MIFFDVFGSVRLLSH